MASCRLRAGGPRLPGRARRAVLRLVPRVHTVDGLRPLRLHRQQGLCLELSRGCGEVVSEHHRARHLAVDATLRRAALCAATYHRRATQDGLFFSPANQKKVPIRNRESVSSANLRKSEYLPPAEIRAAICAVVKTHLGVTRDVSVVETARLFGFRSTSGQLRESFNQEIDLLVVRDYLSDRNERLYINESVSLGRP